MGDLLGSLIWGAKSGQYCVIGGGSLQLRWVLRSLLVLPSFASTVWVFGDQRMAVTRQGGLLLEQRVMVTLHLFSLCKDGAWGQKGRYVVW
jgi:hypothetical protein